jgi:hypothetical protein
MFPPRTSVLLESQGIGLAGGQHAAPRLYWENKLGLYNAAGVSVPAAVSVFPGEN